MYLVVEFFPKKDLAIIPSNWIIQQSPDREETEAIFQVYWPPVREPSKLNKLVKSVQVLPIFGRNTLLENLDHLVSAIWDTRGVVGYIINATVYFYTFLNDIQCSRKYILLILL